MGFFFLLSLLGGARESGAQLFTNLQGLVIQLPAGDPNTTAFDNREGPKGIDSLDLDGDGDADVILSNKDGTLTVYYGRGNGRFQLPQHLLTGAKTLRGLACADVNGDGFPEILSAAPFEGVVFLFRNLGNRTFEEPVAIDTWVGARNLAVGDFNGDTLPDLVVAGTTNGLRQYRGTGGGAFAVVTNLTAFRGAVDSDTSDDDFPKPLYALEVFRPAGSLKDELVFTHTESDETWVMSANGQGVLQLADVLPSSQAYGFDTGPIRERASDGAIDLVIAQRRINRIDIFRHSADSARFGELHQSLHIEGEPRAVRVLDLDGDGWNDLVVALRRLDRVLTYRNSNGFLYVSSELPVGQSPRELAAADFDGDGHPDVAVMNRVSSDVTILLTYAGEVGFVGVDHMYLVDGSVAGLSVLDFNRDGRDDVIQLHQATGDFSVRLAETNGLLSPPVYYTIGNVPSSQVIVDVNNDGLIDQVTASLGPPQAALGLVSVRLGNGDGTFGEERRYPLPPGKEGRLFSLVPADFDGDGNIDLVAGFLDSRIGFFVGAGDGTFSFSREHDLVERAYAMAAGDFDLDGDIDLAGISVAGELVVVENRGDLLTAPRLTKTHYPAAAFNTFGVRSLKTIDFNHDGDLDLLAGGEQGAWLYHGSGGIGFALQSTQLPGAAFPVSSTLQADFDLDGIEDLIVSCRIVSCLSVLTQTPEGTYAPALTLDVPANRYIATGDLDGDGLPDLVGTGKVLWTALSGHSPQRTPPLRYEGQRTVRSGPVINEFLALNTALGVDQDGGRLTDWVEIYNGSAVSLSLGGWRLRWAETGSLTATNEFIFPPTAFLGKGRHLLVFFSEVRRTIYHTGFGLGGDGGILTLVNPTGVEIDRVEFGRQQENVSYGRYRDALASFVFNPYPSPGVVNTDNGPVPPFGRYEGVDATTLKSGERIRFYAEARDDVGLASVSLIYQRLDNPNSPVIRVPLYDDGAHDDGARGDGLFAGTSELGLPAGGELQFYFEVVDVGDETVLLPDNPAFVLPGEPLLAYSLAVGVPSPAIEISEFVAFNETGLQDETGSTPDWVEIRNCSSDPVAMGGFAVSEQLGQRGRFVFPPGFTLAAGEHFVFFADDDPVQGPLHAPFSLGRSGGQLMLTGQTEHGARTLIDWVRYGAQRSDVAYARLGCGGRWHHVAPTPSRQNIRGQWTGLVYEDEEAEETRFIFGFATQPSYYYYVEYTDSVDPPSWLNLPSVAGDGLEHVVNQPMVPNRFYRVRVDP